MPPASGPPFGLLRRRAAAPGPRGLAAPRPLRGGSPRLLAVQKEGRFLKKRRRPRQAKRVSAFAVEAVCYSGTAQRLSTFGWAAG